MSHQTITLVKEKAIIGPLPIGSTYEWTYKTATREQAIQRAWRGLKRDHPNENPMCWVLAEPRTEQAAA